MVFFFFGALIPNIAFPSGFFVFILVTKKELQHENVCGFVSAETSQIELIFIIVVAVRLQNASNCADIVGA